MQQLTNTLQNKLTLLFVGLGLIASLSIASTGSVSALDCATAPDAGGDKGTPKCEVQSGIDGIGGNEAGRGAGAFTKTIEGVINVLLFIIGAAAVIMIIIGGIRYVVSGGDQGAVTGAKNTILYAVVGLVVAIMAYAIVNFVVTKL